MDLARLQPMDRYCEEKYLAPDAYPMDPDGKVYVPIVSKKVLPVISCHPFLSPPE
jgi:hypothetical protein